MRTTSLIACALLLFAAPVQAGDPVEEARIRDAENALSVLANLEKAKDKARLAEALANLEKMHNALKTDSMRGKIQSAIGGLIKSDDLGAVRMKAADSLGRLNDPRGAYAQLKGHLPAVKVTAAGPLPLRVIQAVGSLAPDAAIAPLKRLMEKAKDANVSRYAIQALGKYGWSKKRVSILKDMGSFLTKLRPGVGPKGGRGGGRKARERYSFLSGTLTAALNELTGQELVSAEEWLALYKANKKSPKKLFKVDR